MCVITGVGVATAVATAFKAVEFFQDTQIAKAQSEFEAKEQIRQAKIAENQAVVERQEGIEEARRQKLSSILNMQKEKTIFASGNIATTSQTALNIYEEEETSGELTALNTLKKSESVSDNYLLKANDYYRKASLNSFKAKQTYKNTLMKNVVGDVTTFSSQLGG